MVYKICLKRELNGLFFEKSPKAYLVLADGSIFEGYSMGEVGTTIGEVVFNTCMASYGELLNDPTYYGQIVAQTYPLAGNKGLDNLDKSSTKACGYVVREWCNSPANSEMVTLDKYLKDRKIVGISGVDTRRLTRAVRDKGYINGAITNSKDNIDKLLKKINEYTISGAVDCVTTKTAYTVNCDNKKYNVVVVDYGFSKSMLRPFTSRGCKVTVVPANTSANDIMAYNPDGIILSDGPADPDDNPQLIKIAKELTTKDVPLFCLGLGHQIIALAINAKIEKMPIGHRGSNQPVKIDGTKKIMTTTQNHGYAVLRDSIAKDVANSWLSNVNDSSIEGLKFKSFKGLSVQFIPKDEKDYCDNAWIYDEFITLMGGNKGE